VPYPDLNFHLRWNLPSRVTIHLIVDATDQGGPRDETALPGQSPCEAILRRVQESLSTIEGCKSATTILVNEVDSPATAQFSTGWEVLACCNDTKARVVNQALSRHMAATGAPGGFDQHLPWQRSFPALCRAIGAVASEASLILTPVQR